VLTLAAVAPADLWFADGGACRTFALSELVALDAPDGADAQDEPLFLRFDTAMEDGEGEGGSLASRGAVYVWATTPIWYAGGFLGIANTSVGYSVGEGAAEVRATAALLAAHGASLRLTFCPTCSEAWYGLRASLSLSASSARAVKVRHAGPPPRSAIVDGDGGALSWRIYEADTRRLTVRGYSHLQSGAAAASGAGSSSNETCATASAVAASIEGSFAYLPNPLGLPAAATCARSYAAAVETTDGSYGFGVSVPSGLAGVPSSVSLALDYGDAATYASVTHHLPLHASHDTPPGGTPVERWLDTAYAQPRAGGDGAVGGALFSTLPAYEEGAVLDWTGTKVSLVAGMDVAASAADPCLEEAADDAVGDGDEASGSGEAAAPPPYEGCAVADASGNFSFSAVPPGMYTLRVESLGAAAAAASGGGDAALRAVPLARNVASGEGVVRLGVMLVTAKEAAQGTTRVALSWRSGRADLAVRAVFPYEPPCHDDAQATCAGPSEPCYWEPLCETPWYDPHSGLGCNAGGVAWNCRFCGFGPFPDCPEEASAAVAAGAGAGTDGVCEVFEGRPECADTTWSKPALAGGGGARTQQVVTIGAKAAANYSIFGFTQEARLCSGYGLPSSVALPGGGEFVDCMGSCATGRGYCYADGELCANCVLWEPDAAKGEVSCYEGAGATSGAQGGKLPGTAEWLADPSCAANNDAANSSAAGAGVALPAPGPLAAGCGRLEGELQLISGAAQVGPTVHLPWWQPERGVEGSRGICINAAAETAPVASFPNAPLAFGEYVAWRKALSTPSPCFAPSCHAAGRWTLHWSSRPWQPSSWKSVANPRATSCDVWRARWAAAVADAPDTAAAAGACDAHLPHAEGASSLAACGVAPPASSVARLALTFDVAADESLLLALSDTPSAGCATVNGVDVPWSDTVDGWLVLSPAAVYAGTQLLEWYGYGMPGAAPPEVTLRFTQDASMVEAYEASPESGVPEANLQQIGEAQLCNA